MTQVTVSIGSSIDRERHVRLCLDALASRFDHLRVSRVFESEPVGFTSERNFYNLVAVFESELSVGELQAWCKQLEFSNGRRTSGTKLAHTLDIDLLTVGERVGCVDGVELPRGDIDQYAFVLQPLAELLPEQRHPTSGRRYAELWANFPDKSQILWPVDFIWQGQAISHIA